jgi:AraC-like DNA-binding protein
MSINNSKRISLRDFILNHLSSVAFDTWPDQVELAKLLSISPTTLRQRLMREDTGYQALKNEVRFRRATQEMLGDEPIVFQKLAFEIGFADERTFYRAFKKWSGCTPGVYRTLFKNRTPLDRSFA